jgi:integrase
MGEIVRFTADADAGDRSTVAAAVEEWLASADLLDTTVATYRATLATLVEDLDGVALGEVTLPQIEAHLQGRYSSVAAATWNRHRAAIRSFFAWCEAQHLVAVSPVESLAPRKERRSKDQLEARRAIDVEELQTLLARRDMGLRERTLWTLLYETAARANEVLGLDVEDLDLANRRAAVIGKGGAAETIHWASPSARLLTRLLGGRRRGPVFLTERAPRLAAAAGDVDPDSGRVRLSYRRAAELFSEASGGRTLHQLRHSRLTHLAEAGEDVTLLRAKSRHASLRSLERYARPGDRAIAELTTRHDTHTRRRR